MTAKKTGFVKVKLQDLHPNPFRHMDRYPIRRTKVEALKESIKTTTFGDNIVARRNGGKIEIAYGHHRMIALKELYSPTHEVGVILRELSDEQMLAMMVRENMEEWGADATILLETVEAVVRAYGEGKIDLPPVVVGTNNSVIRYAPGFQADPVGSRDHRPYTAKTLGQFLGWLRPNGDPQDKLLTTLTALTFIEEGVVSKEDFSGLGTEKLRASVLALKKKLRPTMAAIQQRRIASQAATKAEQAESLEDRQQLEAQANAAYRTAQELESPKPKPVIDINDFAPNLASRLGDVLGESDARVQHLRQVIQYQEHLEPAIRDDIVRTLQDIADRALQLCEELQRPAVATAKRLELVSGDR